MGWNYGGDSGDFWTDDADRSPEFQQIWDSLPGDPTAKFNALAMRTGATMPELAKWAMKAGVMDYRALQNTQPAAKLAEGGNMLRPDGEVTDGDYKGVHFGEVFSGKNILDPGGLQPMVKGTLQNLRDGNYADPLGVVESFKGGSVQPVDYMGQGRFSDTAALPIGRMFGRTMAAVGGAAAMGGGGQPTGGESAAPGLESSGTFSNFSPEITGFEQSLPSHIQSQPWVQGLQGTNTFLPGAGGFSNGPEVGGQNYTSPNQQVQPDWTMNAGGGDTTSPISNTGVSASAGPDVQPSGGFDSGAGRATGGGTSMGESGSGFGWNPSTVQTGLLAGSGLYGLYQSNQASKDISAQMDQMNQNAAQQYPNQLNWDLVDQYLRDPMSVLRNNPGYLASVDFVEKEARRHAAKGGYNVSGNKTHHMADVLGKNAESWYNRAWQPIRDAAGLSMPNSAAQIGQVGVNATNTINQTKNRAVSDMFNAGTKAIPSLFKMFEGSGT